MLTIKQYEQYVDGLPRAAHTMEHITNFGKIVARGFVLLSTTIERGNRRVANTLVEAVGGNPIDTEAARARRAAQRKAEERELREKLAALEAEGTDDDAEDDDA